MLNIHHDKLGAAVAAAIEELADLVDPDPVAAYANDAVRRTIECLERYWLGPCQPDDANDPNRVR